MFYRAGVFASCLLLTACNTTVERAGIDDGYGYDDYSFGSSSPALKKTAPVSNNPAACTPDSTQRNRLDKPKLQMADQSPVLGVAVDVPDRMLLMTATDLHIWDLGEGRQREQRPLTENDAALPFGKSALVPGTQFSFEENGQDGSVGLVRNGEVAAKIWLTRSGWAVVDPNGRFDADMAIWEQAKWRDKDNKQLTFRQLADVYYEPALLGRLITGTPFATQSVPDIKQGLALPPASELLVEQRGDRVLGEVRVTDRGGCIGAVRVFHDGKGITVDPPSARAGSGEQEIWRFDAPVHAGPNEFTALATSPQKVEGKPDHLTITVPGAHESDYQPTLHMLAVGINHYAEPTLELNFAVADARAIVTWASSLKQPFNQVSVTEIYDKEATRGRIRESLEKLRQVDPRDTVLVYLAGHGENNGVRWFFLPTEFGREISLKAVTRDGLSSAVLRDELMRIPARHVALVIDACKSGDMRRAFSAATDERYLEWVSRTAGIRVLAATNQDQLAAELTELGHGALTFVLLRGLAGEADRPPADTHITVDELYRYVDMKLPAITERIAHHKQIPMVFEYGPDFPLQELN